MEVVKPDTVDSLWQIETQQSPGDSDTQDDELQSTRKFSYTFSTQPLETDLKKLLTQVTGKNDLASITEVKLKVVSGHAGLHRLSDFTPHLAVLILDGSCIASFRDLGSDLKSLTILSVVRCNMRHLDGVSGFRNMEELNMRENFVSDPSPCAGVKKLLKLDLSGNQISDVSYFTFLRSCRKLRELHVKGNHFSDYEEELKTLLPQLRILDGEKFEDNNCLEQDTVLEGCEDLSSEDEGSTYPFPQSVRNIHLEKMQFTGDGVNPEDDWNNFSKRISENDLNLRESHPKAARGKDEEDDGGDEKEGEKSATESHPYGNDSESSNNSGADRGC